MSACWAMSELLYHGLHNIYSLLPFGFHDADQF